MHQGQLYAEYVEAYAALEECYDQMAHPQKRQSVKRLLDGAWRARPGWSPVCGLILNLLPPPLFPSPTLFVPFPPHHTCLQR